MEVVAGESASVRRVSAVFTVSRSKVTASVSPVSTGASVSKMAAPTPASVGLTSGAAIANIRSYEGVTEGYCQ